MTKHIVYIVSFLIATHLNAQADFSANISSGCGPLNVQFTDQSTSARAWQWDLGNGNKSNAQNPKAIYTVPGYYDITLTITDISGNVYTKQVAKCIHVFDPPVAYFTASRKKLCPNDTVTFFNQSTAGDAPIVKYYWDFGDGSSSTATNPVHSFKTPAYRNISLIATDNNGCFGVKKYTSYIQIWTPPTADFSLDTSLSCNVPTKVTFTSNVFPGGLKHDWDFGNGNTSTQTNPVEKYTKFGKYSVKLTITDANGCQGTKLVPDAVVIDKIALNFSAVKPNVCDTATPIVFTNGSNVYSGYIWSWDFGDGKTDNNFAPTHHYSDYGVYSVTLKVTGPNCFAITKKSNLVRISKNPLLQIRANDTGACQIPYTIKFHANTTSTASVNWDFGDKQTGAGIYTTHEYNKADTFKVFVTAFESTGCKTTDSIYVNPNYLSTYPFGDRNGCKPFSLKLQSRIFETTAPLVSEKWYYNNVVISNTGSVNYYFPDTGTYYIKYAGMSSKGCMDTPTYRIQVGLRSKPSFYTEHNSICIHEEIKLINTTSTSQGPLKFNWYTSEGDKDTTRDFTTSFHSSQGVVTVVLISEQNGCSDTLRKKDSIMVNFPRVNVAVPRLNCSLPTSIPIINSTTTCTQFQWSATPASISQNKDTMWLSSANKDYKIRLFAKNDTTGCADSFEYNISLNNNLPDARARFKLLDTCLPASAKITDESLPAHETYWNVANDTTKIYALNLNPTFNNYGTYFFRRIAINRSAFQVCYDTATVVIVVPKPDTRSSIFPSQGCTPFTITLVDSGYSNGKKAYWKIEDSTVVSTGFKTSYTILTAPASGKIAVSFTALDSLLRCSESVYSELTVTGPVAEINHSFHYTCKNTRLDLSYTKLTNPNLVKINWFVEDTFRSAAATYSYYTSSVKWIKVKLVITDQNGCTSEIIKNIYTRVFKPQIKIFSDVNGAICPPITVSFTDSTYSFNNPVETWNWDFGDGATSNIRNPVHTYSSTGKYTVTLRVKNFIGCIATDSFPAFIDVKGPSGKIITGVDSGCIPWQVSFSTSAKDLKDIVWDFGDGSGGNGTKMTHIFSGKGTYRPSAILEDNAGCKIGLVSDTLLYGLEAAIARVQQITFCENAPLSFLDKSYYAGAPAKNFWKLPPWKYSGYQFQYKPVKGQVDTLQFIALGPLGCNDTLVFSPRKSVIHFDARPSEDTLCPGNLVTFNDRSTSDTQITFRKWEFDGGVTLDDTAKFITQKPGPNTLKLTLKNAYLCEDSITWNGITITGDTAAPKSPELLATSVLSGNELEIRFRKKTSFDWKQYNIYNVSSPPATILRQTNNPEDTLFSLPGLNVLHQSYCIKISAVNFCQKESDWQKSAAHCQVNLVATADTNKVLLNWNSYFGNSLVQTRLYRREMPTGTEMPLALPMITENSFIDSTTVCRKKYSYRLESVFNNIQWTSSSDTAQASPVYKPNIHPPFISSVSVTSNTHVTLLLDTGNRAQNNLWHYTVEKSNNANSFDLLIKIHKGDALEFSDMKTDPANNRYFYRVSSEDHCGGKSQTSRVSSPMLLTAKAMDNASVALRWNAYRYWPGGVQRYDVEMQESAGNFNIIQSTADTQYLVTGAGKYCGNIPVFRIRAYSRKNTGFADSNSVQQSLSNTAMVDAKPEVYIPNAFTPNANGLNELFLPEVIWAKDYHLFIYNRWGNKIAEVSGCGSGWDGTTQGEPAPDGCYAYRLELTAANGHRSYHSGNLLLLR